MAWLWRVFLVATLTTSVVVCWNGDRGPILGITNHTPASNEEDPQISHYELGEQIEVIRARLPPENNHGRVRRRAAKPAAPRPSPPKPAAPRPSPQKPAAPRPSPPKHAASRPSPPKHAASRPAPPNHAAPRPAPMKPTAPRTSTPKRKTGIPSKSATKKPPTIARPRLANGRFAKKEGATKPNPKRTPPRLANGRFAKKKGATKPTLKRSPPRLANGRFVKKKSATKPTPKRSPSKKRVTIGRVTKKEPIKQAQPLTNPATKSPPKSNAPPKRTTNFAKRSASLASPKKGTEPKPSSKNAKSATPKSKAPSKNRAVVSKFPPSTKRGKGKSVSKGPSLNGRDTNKLEATKPSVAKKEASSTSRDDEKSNQVIKEKDKTTPSSNKKSLSPPKYNGRLNCRTKRASQGRRTVQCQSSSKTSPPDAGAASESPRNSETGTKKGNSESGNGRPQRQAAKKAIEKHVALGGGNVRKEYKPKKEFKLEQVNIKHGPGGRIEESEVILTQTEPGQGTGTPTAKMTKAEKEKFKAANPHHGEGRKAENDRGHIWGDASGGKAVASNLISQNRRVNRGEGKKVEQEMRGWIENAPGGTVTGKAVLSYNNDDSRTPTKTVYTLTDRDGNTKTFEIQNPKQEKPPPATA